MKALIITLACILWVLCGSVVIIEKHNKGEYNDVERNWKHVIGLVANLILGPIALIYYKK